MGPSAPRGGGRGGGSCVTQPGSVHGQACAGHSGDMGHTGLSRTGSAGGTAAGMIRRLPIQGRVALGRPWFLGSE